MPRNTRPRRREIVVWHNTLDLDHRKGYAIGMKTAVSVPDAIFRAAERQARRTKKTRSQLYSEALAEYLNRHAPDEVTENANKALERIDQTSDEFVPGRVHP